jgi:hypothetical protein
MKLSKVERAALAWWRSKAPPGWDDAHHRQHPGLNINNSPEELRLSVLIGNLTRRMYIRWKVRNGRKPI